MNLPLSFVTILEINAINCVELGTIYPGLMVTSAVLYHIAWLVNVTIDIRNVCVFLAPFFSSLTTIVTYLLTKELRVRTITYYVHFMNLISVRVVLLFL
jgi:hypothetical protein